MASSKHKGYLKKKPDMVVSRLRKENTHLKNTMVELSRQYSEYYKLVEGFLSLETIRLHGTFTVDQFGRSLLESSQQRTAKDEKTTLPKGGSLVDVVTMQRISTYAREIEEIKNKLVGVATRCQSLEKKVTGKKDSKADYQAPTIGVTEVQNQLRDALEKNKQWLEYDQQREASVRAIMARMLWLEKQLNEANQASSKKHNEEHSHEKRLMFQMQEHYERLLLKAKDELNLLREEVDSAHQKLVIIQNRCKESEMKVEELKKQLHTVNMSSKKAPGDDWSEDEEQCLGDETKDLQGRLDVEKRRSANFELQANFLQKYMLNQHHGDQEKIADLERQIKIFSQDLKDKRQDCSYLKKQIVRILKSLQKTKRHVTKQSKREQQECISCEGTHPPCQLSRESLASAAQCSSTNDSCLECPGCCAQYPVSHYRELMNHLEICLD